MTLVGKHNIARMYSITTGTGTLTLTSAVPGALTFTLSGVVNSERVTYTIRDGANTEVGRGTYTASGTTLSRDTVLSSTNGGSKINCSGRQTVAVTVAAEDMTPFASYYGSSGSVTNNTDNSVLALDTEWIDQAGIASISGNVLTLALKGWYECSCSVYFSSATAFNGYVTVDFEGMIKKQGYTTAMGILIDQLWVGPFTLSAAADANAFGTIKISNHLGSTINAYLADVTIKKLGNQ